MERVRSRLLRDTIDGDRYPAPEAEIPGPRLVRQNLENGAASPFAAAALAGH